MYFMENLQHQFNRYFVDNGATEWWLTGLKTTLLVTVIALCIGVVLGLLIALFRYFCNRKPEQYRDRRNCIRY